MLSADGHQVDLAESGEEALVKLRDSTYDIVITDLKMPGMSGQQLFERIKESDPQLARQVLFMTGDTLSPDTHEFVSGIKNRSLSKPFRWEELREALAKVTESND